MFGEPIARPHKATVLPFVWSYLFKDGVKPKARGTCNGGKGEENAMARQLFWHIHMPHA
jgi:hypothetical protein